MGSVNMRRWGYIVWCKHPGKAACVWSQGSFAEAALRRGCARTQGAGRLGHQRAPPAGAGGAHCAAAAVRALPPPLCPVETPGCPRPLQPAVRHMVLFRCQHCFRWESPRTPSLPRHKQACSPSQPVFLAAPRARTRGPERRQGKSALPLPITLQHSQGLGLPSDGGLTRAQEPEREQPAGRAALELGAHGRVPQPDRAGPELQPAPERRGHRAVGHAGGVRLPAGAAPRAPAPCPACPPGLPLPGRSPPCRGRPQYALGVCLAIQLSVGRQRV